MQSTLSASVRKSTATRRSNHPAEEDLVIKLHELEDTLKVRLECNDDPGCRLSADHVNAMLCSVSLAIGQLESVLIPFPEMTQWQRYRANDKPAA
jgi:hypothetical protein